VSFRVGVVLLGAVLVLPFEAQASCRGYPESVRSAIKVQIEALRMLEREAADRLLGLDTRTFPFLAAEVRKTVDAIADGRTLKLEDELRRCRNWVQPVGRICRNAADALAILLDAQEARAATRELKQAYAASIERCERLVRLAPLKTTIRTSD
jgi:hypothetical protein